MKNILLKVIIVALVIQMLACQRQRIGRNEPQQERRQRPKAQKAQNCKDVICSDGQFCLYGKCRAVDY